MLYGTPKTDISILTHPYTPIYKINGFYQQGLNPAPVASFKGRSYIYNTGESEDVDKFGGSVDLAGVGDEDLAIIADPIPTLAGADPFYGLSDYGWAGYVSSLYQKAVVIPSGLMGIALASAARAHGVPSRAGKIRSAKGRIKRRGLRDAYINDNPSLGDDTLLPIDVTTATFVDPIDTTAPVVGPVEGPPAPPMDTSGNIEVGPAAPPTADQSSSGGFFSSVGGGLLDILGQTIQAAGVATGSSVNYLINKGLPAPSAPAVPTPAKPISTGTKIFGVSAGTVALVGGILGGLYLLKKK